MNKKTWFVLLLAVACLAAYIYLGGISWRSLFLLLLANGFGVAVFALVVVTIGKKMADEAIDNIDKRIEDYRQNL